VFEESMRGYNYDVLADLKNEETVTSFGVAYSLRFVVSKFVFFKLFLSKEDERAVAAS
jgi:hypothetical protein